MTDNGGLYRALMAILGFAIGFTICCLLVGCKTCECIPTVEYRDSVVTRYHHDTIQTYEKDSIYIHQRGDTVWQERWSIRFRDKIVERHDTIQVSDKQVIVKTQEVIPNYYRNCTRGFWILVALLCIGAAIRILIRVYLKK